MGLDLEFVRAQFPALSGEWTFLDNAGGSQTLVGVADRVRDYLLRTNVQLGASYDVSVTAEERVLAGERALATFVNTTDPSEIVVGSSTSALVRTFANSLAQTLVPGDEVIVTNCDHEANIGPWVELERFGVRIRTWEVERDSLQLETDDLAALLNDRTKLVAVTHASNVLGSVNPVRTWSDLVHDAGAKLFVDGVAYAPHRLIDVHDLDVDFYVFSLYKVYGPHLGVMYAKREHLLSLPRQNHFFIGNEDIPYKLQPGSRNYELTYSAEAIVEYVGALGEGAAPRAALATAFAKMSEQEAKLGSRLLDWLASKDRVRVIGSPTMNAERLPTVSFVVDGIESSAIPPHADRAQIGIRWGDFYARRLIDALDLGPDGVIRVSAVHYNTLEEIDRLIEVLDPVVELASVS